jgi:hypothetical protein
MRYILTIEQDGKTKYLKGVTTCIVTEFPAAAAKFSSALALKAKAQLAKMGYHFKIEYDVSTH